MTYPIWVACPLEESWEQCFASCCSCSVDDFQPAPCDDSTAIYCTVSSSNHLKKFKLIIFIIIIRSIFYLFCDSLKILSLRFSCHATFSGCFRPHGMQKQHFRLAGLLASVTFDPWVCSTLFVRRQHKNLLRHSEHFPGSFTGDIVLLSAIEASVRETLGSDEALRDRRQQPQNLDDFSWFVDWSVLVFSSFVDLSRRQRLQQALFRIRVQGMHRNPKHGLQQRRHWQQLGLAGWESLLSESLSPGSDLIG